MMHGDLMNNLHGVAERPKSQLFQLKQSLLPDDDSITEDSRQQDLRVELEFTGGEERLCVGMWQRATSGRKSCRNEGTSTKPGMH